MQTAQEGYEFSKNVMFAISRARNKDGHIQNAVQERNKMNNKPEELVLVLHEL